MAGAIFVLGATDVYQSLHIDVGGGPIYAEGPPPAIGVSFIVEDLPCAAGPVRVLPGSQYIEHSPPILSKEPEMVKGSLLCPLPRGSVVLRDLRLWHGGTPNSLNRTRYLPGSEFVSSAWAARKCGSGDHYDPCRPVLPKELHETLGPTGWSASSRLVDTTGAVEQLNASGSWLLRDFAIIGRHRADAY